MENVLRIKRLLAQAWSVAELLRAYEMRKLLWFLGGTYDKKRLALETVASFKKDILMQDVRLMYEDAWKLLNQRASCSTVYRRHE